MESRVRNHRRTNDVSAGVLHRAPAPAPSDCRQTSPYILLPWRNKMIKPSLKNQACMQDCYNEQFYYV